jgi:hypothetical protein
MNVKTSWMFIEYNGVSVISGNLKQIPMNIMLIPPNGKNLILFFVVKVYCGKQSATYH